ncbi:hypothetical protein ACOJBM_22630 [Rhizobium beringeri]
MAFRGRPTLQAKANFDMAGIAGLVPAKPGPRGPHKVDGDVLAFLQAQLAPGEPVRARELASCSARNSISSFIPDRSSGF